MEKTNITVNVVCSEVSAHSSKVQSRLDMAVIGPDGPTGTSTDEDGTMRGKATLAPALCSREIFGMHSLKESNPLGTRRTKDIRGGRSAPPVIATEGLSSR